MRFEYLCSLDKLNKYHRCPHQPHTLHPFIADTRHRVRRKRESVVTQAVPAPQLGWGCIRETPTYVRRASMRIDYIELHRIVCIFSTRIYRMTVG